jgi:hypothetical protein
VEFFLGCYDFVEEDLRRVVEVSRSKGKILVAFNTTVIALIPKSDNPTSFEIFGLISPYNCICKILYLRLLQEG